MKNAAEYRRHAADCRALAAHMGIDEHREQLLHMAARWDELAETADAGGCAQVGVPLECAQQALGKPAGGEAG